MGLKPDEFAEDCTGMINDTVASVLEGKYLHKKIPSCATLETYEETHIFFPINIKEQSFELGARRLLGGSGPGGTVSEALHVWLMKVGEDNQRLRTSVDSFVDWLANGSPP